MSSEFLQTYRNQAAGRALMGIPPLALTAQQTAEVIELLKNPPKGEEAFLLELITHRVPAGVDDAASASRQVSPIFKAAISLGFCQLF